MKYCSECGSETENVIPEGDNRPRDCCKVCNLIHYTNPKIICGTIPCKESSVLLCKRAIEPRYGKWTLPGGFMENGETVSEGAFRETKEETNTEEAEIVNETIKSKEALEIGLINEVVDEKKLRDTVIQLSKKIASLPRGVLELGKKTFYSQYNLTLSDAYKLTSQVMVENLSKKDSIEGINAFIQKRKANWFDD